MKKLLARTAFALAIVVLATACGNSRVVKREGSRPSSPPRTVATASRNGQYVVRAGDTLYGIAFRHGLDYREVARWNRIPAPYTIYPGQPLNLRGTATASPASPGVRAVAALPAARPGSAPAVGTASASAGTGFVTVSTPSPGTSAASVASAESGVRPATAPAAVVAAPVVVPLPTDTAPALPLPTPSSAVSASGWRWPTQGPLIGRFLAGDPKRQGLDIAGTAGQPVVAASDGVVVYSGAGLVGYGELIIIKHSDEWLSAYAHNRRRLVAEGTAVKAGQAIAELGRSGTSRDMLHFEVRRNGKPIDPLIVLPAP